MGAAGQGNDLIGIIGPVGEQKIGFQVAEQEPGHGAISGVATGDDHAHRQAMGIDSQMQLGV